MSNPYDQLEYPSVALPQTWPDRLATLATLHGLKPNVEDCRVLEVGCGDGVNLVAIGLAMPRAQCVGIELAAAPVARGRELIRRAGVTNVTLRQADLADVGDDLGPFDYVVAHGVYSWVPPHVRDRVLEICGNHVAPHGVAYVSYNALPGGYLRQMVRRMMMWHVRGIDDPRRRVAEARNLLALLVRAHAPNHPITHLLRIELQRISSLPDAQVFHDDLAPFNDAVAFDEFTAHAARHGLQFLAEADLESVCTDGLPEPVQAELARLSRGDVTAREVYLDFFRDTTFRQTLLCRADVPLARPPAPASVRGLYVASDARPVAPQPELHTPKLESFKAPSQANVTTGDALVKGALAALAGAWPRAMRVDDELLGAARSGARLAAESSHVEQLGQALLTLCAGGLVRLHARPRAVVIDPPERPLASPLARAQAADGPAVTTLDGETLRLESALGRRLLQLLDGTRDRAALLSALAAGAGAAGGAPVTSASLDAALRDFGRAGLLVG